MFILSGFICSCFFFFNDTATTEIYTLHIVGSVRCVQETVLEVVPQKRNPLYLNWHLQSYHIEGVGYYQNIQLPYRKQKHRVLNQQHIHRYRYRLPHQLPQQIDF
eukprot:TRINITY_DN15367_c0_g1_i2.p3 TRINITY_DN15367_c0_g1~~TRINITY_DN15367_c0_g1_i2.p3  ORF type:complete len:105 (+),score=15.22 TRINITY_DN15367_c0_g1_i2:56-370(+)